MLLYVGPGAGVAVATTALVFVVSAVLTVVGLLLYPIRLVYRLITRKRAPKPAQIKRAVIVGLDGLDPDVTQRLLDQGRLPNLQKLADAGTFRKLKTTFPAMSPVAWSSFATGVNPAKHGIFDFLTRDRRTYLPDLSSAEVGPPRHHLTIGKMKIPIGAPQLKLLRKSKTFWEILGKYNVPCTILRVPITFPPQSFEGGTMLSAMCVPDLQGSQGTFTHLSSRPVDDDAAIGGRHIPVQVEGDTVKAHLFGPPNPVHSDGEPLRLPLSFHIDRKAGTAELHIGRERITLEKDRYTDWTQVAFPLGLGMKMRGICRFRLLELEPHFRVYVTPINIDPAKPVLPISYPNYFSIFLAKLVGRFATLGLAEDTWALNEKVLDEQAFLEQAWDNHRERESQFFEMLSRTPKGVITCVFDGTDRIQHMFMRYMDDGHPALTAAERNSPYSQVIEETYERMDAMVGRVMEKVDIQDPNNLLMVISDHGFKTFRRGVNLNSWLYQNGYLAIKQGCDGSGEWFRDVDWSRTKAFALGLGGIFLNVKGREAQGMVAPGAEANALADELATRLRGLVDTDLGTIAIHDAYPAHSLYKGPYADQAPDLIVGYAAGWRASWDGVRGITNQVIFDDNTKAWSGDHCIDPELVPGVLFCNRPMGGKEDPAISDLAPTLLEQFGVPAPRYMDGTSIAPA